MLALALFKVMEQSSVDFSSHRSNSGVFGPRTVALHSHTRKTPNLKFSAGQALTKMWKTISTLTTNQVSQACRGYAFGGPHVPVMKIEKSMFSSGHPKAKKNS